eukprot:TRINITY_DN556_c0_g1_i2.p4 TRINITY_DN556_c0_g1~~TRINITY_DN556_c0_g1_i2.p4  ORF type:complete len:117 (+),score=0.64 TRINITY_DN556_c0_g1_i2:502-852(+)
MSRNNLVDEDARDAWRAFHRIFNCSKMWSGGLRWPAPTKAATKGIITKPPKDQAMLHVADRNKFIRAQSKAGCWNSNHGALVHFAVAINGPFSVRDFRELARIGWYAAWIPVGFHP